MGTNKAKDKAKTSFLRWNPAAKRAFFWKENIDQKLVDRYNIYGKIEAVPREG